MTKRPRDPFPAGKYKLVLIAAWGAVLVFCLLNRDRFTVDGVLSYTPRNPVLAAVFILALFALKSVSVFIFSGILLAATGMLFPLPAAILLNVLGSAIMVSLPYWLGRKLGKDALDRVVDRYPKAAVLRRLRTDHGLLLSFVLRAVNVLPSDILSLYLGALGIDYRQYLPGSLLGMLLSLITFPIMGMSLTEPGSPAFLWSVGVQAAVSAVSVGCCWCYFRRRAGREGRQ